MNELRDLGLAGDVWAAERRARGILAADPGNVEAALHLVSAIRWQRDPAKYPEAIALAQSLLASNEENIEFQMNRAGMLFELGDHAAAVNAKYRARYAPSRMRRWRGESLARKSLLVLGHPHPDIAGELVPFGQLGGLDARRVLWMTTDARWRPLLERSDSRVRVIQAGLPAPERVDSYVAHVELPRFTLKGGRLVRPRRYIKPDQAAVARYAALLPSGRRIGLAWRGGRAGLADYRNPPLSCFAALAGLPATFVCLQYGDTAADLAQLRSMGIEGHSVRGWDPLASLDDAFALTETCDVVVTNDQSAAHIAGALGKPTYLLSAFYSHFTTYGPPGRSVFYPTLQVLTQPRLHDWPSVFLELRAKLDEANELQL